MIEQDTIKLLRECDAGIKMGVSSINDVLSHVSDHRLEQELTRCKDQHLQLQTELQQLLSRYQDQGKDPNVLAKGMSWVKTNLKLSLENTDATVADLMTDGCNMGVKSLSRYLNQYAAADEKSKDIAKRLIAMEQKLTQQIQPYL